MARIELKYKRVRVPRCGDRKSAVNQIWASITAFVIAIKIALEPCIYTIYVVHTRSSTRLLLVV